MIWIHTVEALQVRARWFRVYRALESGAVHCLRRVFSEAQVRSDAIVGVDCGVHGVQCSTIIFKNIIQA